jgi:fructokinase
MKVLSIGEVLWDVFDETEMIGGAPLNFAASLLRLGDYPEVLSAVGADIRGELAVAQIEARGLSSRFIQFTKTAPTGVASVTLDGQGNSTFIIDRPAAYDMVTLTPSLMETIAAEKFDWVYYGTLLHTGNGAEDRLEEVFEALPRSRGFYDVNLRRHHWNLPLVERLSQKASVMKVNSDEAETLYALECPAALYSLEAFCAFWSESFQVDVICVTRGIHGAAIWEGGTLHRFAGYPVQVADTVGAGDSFAAVFLHGHHNRWPTARTARLANAVGALVASRAGALPEWSLQECETLIASQVPRSAGSTEHLKSSLGASTLESE